MSDKFDYKNYPVQPGIKDYNKYQQRYAQEPRFSDQVILDLVGATIGTRAEEKVHLLDIGCSTGNLLGHLKNRFPRLQLFGGELAESSLDVCTNRHDLSGIHFDRLDVMQMDHTEQFDVIITNAVTYLFDWDQYETAIQNISRALLPGGSYIAFEWLHPFIHQDIQIFETTVFLPKGLRISVRPFPKVEAILKKHGFSGAQFMPFSLPIALPMPAYDDEVTTYTIKAADGRNLCFRGALYQPWCHMIATKSSQQSIIPTTPPRWNLKA